MPIKDLISWNKEVEAYKDSYGKYLVDTARRVMDILDNKVGDFDCHTIICEADIDDNLTGFMTGVIASMVFQCHTRGEEFCTKWNLDNQIGNEGEKANKEGGTLNPALVNIEM